MHDAFLTTLQGDDWPQITALTVDESTATLALVVQPSLTWFEGHFPGHPVLPGVVQVHIASTIGCGLFDIDLPFVGIDRLKFQRIITPGRALRLELDYDRASDRLSFEFRDTDERCSAGCVLFGQ